ncbi:MAG TPA: cyclic nucleotide-binding domain-containing protein, partial [Bacteroidia bacterium]
MEFDLEKYYLKSTFLFDSLSDDETKFVKTKMIRKEYLKNEYLFKERSYSKGVYILRKGKVKIFQTNKDGKHSLVYIY